LRILIRYVSPRKKEIKRGEGVWGGGEFVPYGGEAIEIFQKERGGKRGGAGPERANVKRP